MVIAESSSNVEGWPSVPLGEVENFTTLARKHRRALQFLMQGAEDYAATRCCLLNGQFPGLYLAQQAVEKHLKATLMLAGETVGRTHDLHRLSERAEKLGLTLRAHSETLSTLSRHWEEKYPDRPGSRVTSTRELMGIDSLMAQMVDQIPMPGPYLRVATGVLGHCFSTSPVLADTRMFLLDRNRPLHLVLAATRPLYLQWQQLRAERATAAGP